MSVKIGIISFAHLHADFYAPVLQRLAQAQFVGVYDDDAERAQEAADRYGVACYAELDELLAACEAVIVTAENVRHHHYTLAAARAGCHVLCEKPIATSEPDAREMIAACRAAGVQLMISFPCRYSPAYQAAYEAVQRGELGRILAMSGTNRGQNPGGWFTDPLLAGGGTVMDHTVHVVDVMRRLTGDEVVSVFCEKDTVFAPGLAVEDCGIVSLAFAGGAQAALDCSWSRPRAYPVWGDVTLTVIGENGNLFLDLFSEHVDFFSHTGPEHTWLDYGYDVNEGLIADFLRCVEAGEPVPITGEDGLAALQVALAAYRSAELATVVEV